MQQEIPIITETTALTKITPIKQPLTPTPISKAEILEDIYNQREKLKHYRDALEAGTRRPSELMKAICYITQLILSADKIALDTKSSGTTVRPRSAIYRAGAKRHYARRASGLKEPVHNGTFE